MSDFARWERESQEDVHAPAPPPSVAEETVELDMEQAIAAADLEDPPEYEYELYDQDGDGGEESGDGERAGRERIAAARESLTATRQSLGATAGRVGRWLHSLDRRPELDSHLQGDEIAQLTAGAEPPEASEPPPAAPDTPELEQPEHPEQPGESTESGTGEPARFPTAALGYNRQAVDEHVAALERELEALRARTPEPVAPPPLSITEEIERLGEQTASILVVAHDKAHETARLAHEQAERAVSAAAAEAERLTSDAALRLRELDEETDAVWRERERLLEDVRVVSRTLQSLADDASSRFPADEARSLAV